jgi:hypothetical protein
VLAIQSRIQDLRDRVGEMSGRSAERIAQMIAEVVAVQIDDSFAELRETAAQVHANVLARLRSMHAEQLKIEQERAEAEAKAKQRQAELDAEIARQRAERTLNESRMKVIAAINRLPMVATTGRNPDRKPGTRETITATLEEARNFEVSEQEFGPLYDAALEARRGAVEQIEHLLQRFDERAADAARREQEERERQVAADRQRAEQQRLDSERAAAQAEQERIAAENARQAEQLRQQQAELERQRQEQEAAARAEDQRLASQRAELERQQQEIAAAQAPSPSAPVEGPQAQVPAAAEEFVPSAADLVALVSIEYGVALDTARSWLTLRFGGAA